MGLGEPGKDSIRGCVVREAALETVAFKMNCDSLSSDIIVYMEEYWSA